MTSDKHKPHLPEPAFVWSVYPITFDGFKVLSVHHLIITAADIKTPKFPEPA